MGLFGIPGLRQVNTGAGLLNAPVGGVFQSATVFGGLAGGWGIVFLSGTFQANASPSWTVLNRGSGKSSAMVASKGPMSGSETFSSTDTQNAGQFPYNYVAAMLVFGSVPTNQALVIDSSSQNPLLGNLVAGSQLIVGLCNINTYGNPNVVDSLGRFSFTRVDLQSTAGNNSGNVAVFICPSVVGGSCTLNITGNVGGSVDVVSTSPFSADLRTLPVLGVGI